MAASRMNTRKANRRVRFLNSASISAFLFCFIGEGVPVVTESATLGESGTLLSITALMDGLSLGNLGKKREVLLQAAPSF
ncbi:hypothetical protein D3C77_702730 [compost metagenome]